MVPGGPPSGKADMGMPGNGKPMMMPGGHMGMPPQQQVFAFTAPRMSNAFARRHGLNPKDNPMLNLQKIALQSQVRKEKNLRCPTSV